MKSFQLLSTQYETQDENDDRKKILVEKNEMFKIKTEEYNN